MPPIRTARAPVRPPRRRNHELDAYTRTKLVELRKNGLLVLAQIYTQYPTILISIIKLTVYREAKRIKN